MKKIIMAIIILGTLVGCSSEKEVVSDAIKFKNEYEELNGEKTSYGDYSYRNLDIDDDNPIIYKSAKEVLDMIQSKETFLVYFGFSDCPWCRSVIETLLKVSNDLDITNIYYVDVKDIRDTLNIDEMNEVITTKEGSKEYYRLLDELSNVLDDYTLTDKNGNEVNTNKKRIYAPNIVAIVDGVATKMTTGISDKQTDAFMELTDEIKNESYDMIKCTLECIKEEKAICTNDSKKC